MTSVEEHKEIVRRVTEHGVNTGNLEVFRQVLDADYVRHSQATTEAPEIRGIEQMLDFLQHHFDAFPDWHEEIEVMLAEGDKVAYVTSGTGTNAGALGDLPPTGRQVQVTTFVVHRMAGGRIVETWVGWDNVAMLSQLGLMTPPKM